MDHTASSGEPMDHKHRLQPDAKSLEDAFFAQQDALLLKKLREEAKIKARRDALRAVLPNADETLLDHLMALDIQPETALAIILVPLAAVAWADGEMDARERDAILRAAAERGITSGSPAHTMLTSWLDRQPNRRLMDTWKRYIQAMWNRFDPAEREAMRTRLIGMAREVARSAGGILGLGKISAAEQAVLDDLEKALT